MGHSDGGGKSGQRVPPLTRLSLLGSLGARSRLMRVSREKAGKAEDNAATAAKERDW